MKSFQLLLILLTFAGSSCSSKKVASIKTGEEQALRPAPKPIISGPTKPENAKKLLDKTKEYGLLFESATHLYAVDWSGDGKTDLVILPDYYSPPKFLKYSEGQFLGVKSSPLEEGIRASFLVFADFNKDGLLDMIIATLNQKTELNKYPLRLFLAKKRGKGVRYYEVKGAFPDKKMPTSSLSLIDVNMDGWLDIYIGNWFDYSTTPVRNAPDRIYLGAAGGKKWQDASYLLEGELKYDKDIKIYPNARPTFGTTACDVDQNGYPDILTASSSGYQNKMWMNLNDNVNKDRILKDYADKSGVASDAEGSFDPRGGGNSFYLLCNDYNNDSIMDIAAGELFHSYDPESRDRSSILTGSRTTFPPLFIRTEYHKDDGSGSWSQGDRRAVWADIDFNGQIDLIVNNSGFPPKSRLIFFRQDFDHSYGDEAEDLAINILNPSGTVVMDVNRDGRPDIVTGQVNLRSAQINPRIYAFENNYPWQGRRVLKVTLKGRDANAQGIGATVVLKTNKSSYKRNVEYSYGSLPSQNEDGLWFGLSKGEELESIEVRWPLLRKDRAGREYPVRFVYKIKSLKFKENWSISLNDNGSWKSLY